MSRYCKNCGRKLEEDEKFCENCGTKAEHLEKGGEAVELNKKYSSNDEWISSEDERGSDRSRFIDRNVDYYTKKFDSMDAKESSISWNWASFIFGSLWFLYRKLYLLGACLIGITYLVNSYCVRFRGFIDIGICVLCGLFANKVYENYVDRHVEKGSSMTESEKNTMIRRFGGVSVIGVVIALIVIGVISTVLENV